MSTTQQSIIKLLQSGIDISLPVRTDGGASAWYVAPPTIEPVRADAFVGAVTEGGSVNFRNVFFNPHGHGTHTECVGHISPTIYSINQRLRRWFFEAQLVTVSPEAIGDDRVITAKQLMPLLRQRACEALVIRTLPNNESKRSRNYSNTNPAYFEAELAKKLREAGVVHLLLDLPSVDREMDGGELAAHKAFWNYPADKNSQATITELVFVPNEVSDGIYLLNLQVAPIENDAAPSRPVLYKI